MEKRIKLFVAGVIFITLICYVAGSVAGASFNPFCWEEETRVKTSVGWVFIIIIFAIAVGDTTTENK